MRSPTQTKTKSSFVPVNSGLLQRKCACENSVSLTGECSKCQSEKTVLQRRATNQDEVSEVPPIIHEVLNSPGQSLDSATRTLMESRFGHDFSQVQVHTDSKAAESAKAVNALAYTLGRDVVFGTEQYDPYTVQGRKLLAHELTHVIQQTRNPNISQIARQANEEEEKNNPSELEAIQSEKLVEKPENLDESPSELQSGRSACPVTAVFSSTLAGREKSDCLVPQGKHGASKLARFRLAGINSSSGTASVTIGEQFKPIDDPYAAFSLLKPNSFTTSGQIFDDCYMFASNKPLPSDFRLKVEQNHLVNGQIISKNHITYMADSISFCFFQRLPGKCDFGGRCRL